MQSCVYVHLMGVSVSLLDSDTPLGTCWCLRFLCGPWCRLISLSVCFFGSSRQVTVTFYSLFSETDTMRAKQ